jgi:hypothetical protein
MIGSLMRSKAMMRITKTRRGKMSIGRRRRNKDEK